MEWELKMPPWDLAELGRDGEPSLGSLVSSSSSLGRQATSPLDCSVDLKLGGSGNFELFHSWKSRPGRSTATTVSSLSSSAMAVSSSASSKRARTLGSGAQNASCLVDGCTSDLSNCREYHRRHKVCEVHSKTPIVMVKGHEQRFCQQCSRFHLLVEFDEVKRSCRKRLDGHNRRRRKPQPADAINTGRFFADRQGSSRFSSFSPMFSGGVAAPEPNWAAAAAAAAAMKAEEDAALYGQGLPLVQKQDHHLLGSFSRGYYHHQHKEGRQFPFLEEGGYGGRAGPAAAVVAEIHPLLGAIATSESSDSKIFSSGGFAAHGHDSDCALSLLSSPTQNSGINDPGGATAAVAEDRIPMGQPLLAVAGGLHQYGLSLFSRSSHASSHVVSPTGFSCAAAGMEEQVGGGHAVLVADAGDAGLHSQGYFHLGIDGGSDRASQAVPFSWQ